MLVLVFACEPATVHGTRPHEEATPLQVLFAGHMFVTNATDVPVLFPRLSAVLQQEPWSAQSLGQMLAEKYHGFSTDTFVINAQDLASNAAASPLVMGLAFDSELISVESFVVGRRTTYKVLGELSAQALFFDFNTRSLVAAYPLIIQRVDLLDHSPTPAEEIDVVRKLLASPDSVNMLSVFDAALRRLSLRVSPAYRLGFGDVVFDESVRAHMPPWLEAESGRAERALANRFAQWMATHQAVAMVPFTAGQAVAGGMALRYANGEMVNLKLPSPDFVFNVTITGIRKVELKRGPGASVYAYGVFARIHLGQALSNRSYLDVAIKHVVTKTIPTTQRTVDDWATYQETMLDLIDEFTVRLGRPGMKAWLAPRMTGSAGVPDLKDVTELMERIR